MPVPPLRPYQLEAVEQLRQGIREGKKKQILCAPTGSGKTVIAAHLVEEAYAKGKKVAFCCDLISLVDQTSAAFADFGIPHGVVQGENTYGRDERVQVCSIQTVERRGFLPRMHFMIGDEASPNTPNTCLLYTSPSPRDRQKSRMPSSA